jgi:hypothetical protein
MKTTHLRIGSIVEYDFDLGWCETKLDAQDLEVYTDKNGNFTKHRPVPITPERLLLNGFGLDHEMSTHSYSFDGGTNVIFLHVMPNAVSVALMESRPTEDVVLLPPIHHLHELQNLMMVLFDKEII